MRAFIAIPIPEEIRSEIHEFAVEMNLPGMSVVSEDNMHITLRFFEYIDDAQAEKIKAAMDRVKHRQFWAEIFGIGTFDHSMRVVFAGITDNGESEMLFNELNAELKGIGEPEKGFRPHITMARLKDPNERQAAKEIIELNKDYDFGSFTASKIVLIKSELGPSGAKYILLKETELPPS